MTYFVDSSRLPGDTEMYRWADWAELLAWTSADGAVSIDDLAEKIEQRRDTMASEISDDRDLSKAVEPDELLDEAAQSQPAEFKDRTLRRAVSVFDLLTERARSFGGAYPFELSEDNELILRNGENIARNIYGFLLTCSSLRYVPESGGERQRLTSSFERLSLLALSRRLPIGAEVHAFGSTAAIRGTKFDLSLLDRIAELASSIHEFVTPKLHKSKWATSDRGDHGLDLVAWVPWSDGLSAHPVYFGQAACTGSWISKQASSSYQRWAQVITFTSPPVNMVFVPFDFRTSDGSWYADQDIRSTVMWDRRRLMESLGLLDGQIPAAEIDAKFLSDIGSPGIEAARYQDLADI